MKKMIADAKQIIQEYSINYVEMGKDKTRMDYLKGAIGMNT